MLTFIRDIQHPLLEFIKDDPVRPDIPVEFRVSGTRFVSTLSDDFNQPRAVVCVSLHDFVPSSIDELMQESVRPTAAIFYTIWSYVPGAATELLTKTVRQIQEQFPEVTRFVTLSPKTPMARRFHLKNGAEIFRENEFTINYEYRPPAYTVDKCSTILYNVNM
jgi:hypothetical protein